MRLALVLLLAIPSIANAVDVFQEARTSILIIPVACPQKAECNVFHARFIKNDGVVMFSRDIPSKWMASNVSIEVRTEKGVFMVWSDR